MDSLLDLDWQMIVSHLVRIGIAFALAAPVGWDREARSRGAGLRTFPLVAAGSCGFLMLGQAVLEGSESHARLLYGLMTGLGFIGGGSILKDRGTVSGTATAAAIWNTGAIGAAVAWQRYEIALLLSAVTFVTLRFVRPLKHLVREEREQVEAAERSARDPERPAP